MNKASVKKLTEELLDKPKWADFLRRFIDVLRINIFVVDPAGRIFIPPHGNGESGLYGSKFLTSSFGFNFSAKGSKLLEKFEEHGSYLEYRDPFDFYVFSVPVRVENEIIAYMIVGPVVLNKRKTSDDYFKVAAQLNFKKDDLMDIIYEIRVVSFVTIKAVLDLLSEVVKDIIELRLEKKRLHQMRFNKDVLSKETADAAKDLYTAIHLDELLVTVMDVALNLTRAECGSIMLLDEDKKALTIKVSRGIDEKKVLEAQPKIGEGIAGIAAKENASFIISGERSDNRIKHLLQRSDIKQSVVIPLSVKNRVFGVLSLHTKREERKIEVNEQNLQNLSKLISTAICSI